MRRRSERVQVTPKGVQRYQARYSLRRRENGWIPRTPLWRCNLTGLSQTRNLYFVVNGEHIDVYVPQFPTQAIPQQVAVSISTPGNPSNPRGHIDPRHGRDINYLLVAFLGEEEVVAVVRDDGDVDAYLVRHVEQAIARREEPDCELTTFAQEVKAFFVENVGASAWGLAIHTEARILAVSSNTCEVWIFAFGLTGGNKNRTSEEKPNASVDDDGPESHRESDYSYGVINGENYIPYIAFCNTGDDPTARWLLTTDIDGISRVLDISLLSHASPDDFRATLAFNIGREGSIPGSGIADSAGWIITFLDKRSFRPESDLRDALGLECEASMRPLIRGRQMSKEVWDISSTAIPPASFPRFASTDSFRSSISGADENAYAPVAAPADDDDDDDTMNEDSIVARDDDNDDEQLGGGDQHDDDGFENSMELDQSAEDDIEDDDGGISLADGIEHDTLTSRDDSSAGEDNEPIPSSDTDVGAPEEDIVVDDPRDSVEASHEANPSAVSENEASSGIDVDQNEQAAEVEQDNETETDHRPLSSTSGTPSHSRSRLNMPRKADVELGLDEDLPCPIFHTSFHDVHLLQPYSKRNGGASGQLPIVSLIGAFRHEEELWQFRAYERFDRLNMYAEIAPLGILVVASQKGRALILSLTKSSRKSASYPSDLGTYDDKTNYSMRLECVLPSPEQLRTSGEMLLPLYGIAVSPLQGSKKTRWRLMMMYYDHSILSYEISRSDSTNDPVVAV